VKKWSLGTFLKGRKFCKDLFNFFFTGAKTKLVIFVRTICIFKPKDINKNKFNCPRSEREIERDVRDLKISLRSIWLSID